MQDTKLVLLTVMPQERSLPSNVQSEHYGGLVGRLSDSTITNSYATGDVSSPSNVQSEHYGGLVGYSVESAITTCYATGDVSLFLQSVMVGLLALPLTQQLLHVTRLEILSLLGILGMYYIILVGLLAFRIARRQLLIVTRLGLHQALQVLIIMAGLLAIRLARPSLAKASITTRILMA